MVLNVALIHGLNSYPWTLWALSGYLTQTYGAHINIVTPSYNSRDIFSDQELSDRVHTSLLATGVSLHDPIIFIGQSLGGVAAMVLHKHGWNVKQAISIAAPLHGANKVLRVMSKLWPWKFARGTYIYLKHKSRMPVPPHPYKTLTFGILNWSFDGCVHVSEAKLEDEHHVHETWFHHSAAFAHKRLWQRVADIIDV